MLWVRLRKVNNLFGLNFKGNVRILETMYVAQEGKIRTFQNKPKMAYRRDLPKIARWMTGMDT